MKNSTDWLLRAERIIRRIVADQHDRPSLVSDMACKIGAEIIEGRRLPGSDLNSVELSRVYSTSRTPVREALMLLEKQGLVSIPPRRRPRVFEFDVQQIREIYRVRGALLEFVAAEIAENASLSLVGKLEDQVGVMDASQNDVEAYLWANIDFYDLLTDAGGNRFVKQVVDSFLLRTIPLRRISLSRPGRLVAGLDDHLRLVRAFRERDSNLASALVRSNHRAALTNLETYFKHEFTPARVANFEDVEIAS